MGRILPGDLGDAFAPTRARAITRRLPFWERAADRFLTPQTAGKVADYYMAYSALQGGKPSPGAVEEGGRAAAALFAPSIAKSRVAGDGTTPGGTGADTGAGTGAGTVKKPTKVAKSSTPEEKETLSYVEGLLQNNQGVSTPPGGIIKAPGKFPETRPLSDAQAAEPLGDDPIRQQRAEEFARQYTTPPSAGEPLRYRQRPGEPPIVIKSPSASDIARQRVPAPPVSPAPVSYSQSRPDPDAVRAPDAPKFQNYGEAKERVVAAGQEAQDAFAALEFERAALIGLNPVMRDQAYRWIKNLVISASNGTDEEVERATQITSDFPTYNAQVDGRLYRLPEEEEAALMTAYFNHGMPAQDREFIDSGHPHLVKAVDDAVANTQGLRATLQAVGRETLGGRGQMAFAAHGPLQQKWISEGPGKGGKLRPDGHNPGQPVWSGISIEEEPYRELIRGASQEAAARYPGVDPQALERFMVAIGRTENNKRDPAAISPTGPVGLWQFTAKTWKAASSAYPGEDFELVDRVDPAISTAVASDYVARLLLKYNNDLMRTALAYNQGEGFLRKYEQGQIKAGDPDLDAGLLANLNEGLAYQAKVKNELGKLQLEQMPLPTGGVPGVLGMSMSPQAQTDSMGFGPPETDIERYRNSLRSEPLDIPGPLTSPPLDIPGPEASPPLDIPGPEASAPSVTVPPAGSSDYVTSEAAQQAHQQQLLGKPPAPPAQTAAPAPAPAPAAPAEAPAAQVSAAPGQAVIEGKPVTDTQGAPVTQITVDRVLTQLDKLGSLEAQRVFVENALRRPNLRPEEANALLVGAQALRGYIKPKTMAEALAQVRSGINPGDQWFNTVTRGMSIDRRTAQQIADEQATREYTKKRREQILNPDKGGIAKQQKELGKIVQRSVYDKITAALNRVEQAQKKDTKLNVAAFKKRIDRYKKDLSDLQQEAARAITKGAGKVLSQQEYDEYVNEVNQILAQLSDKITGVDDLISPEPKPQANAGAGVSSEAADFMANPGRKQ